MSTDVAKGPVVRTSGPEVIGGHGMRLVDLLASRWGTRTHDDAKTVWLTIDRPHTHHNKPAA